MKILIGHNQYQFFGGEDAVAQAEQKLLLDHGHDVKMYTRSNKELHALNMKDKTRFVWYLAWVKESYSQMRQMLREYKPDIVHFHNIYFMMSPAVYHACKDEGVAVVQSLHNFRPLCANGLFFRKNQVCEKCLNGSLANGVIHRCYQDSLIISAMVVRMLRAHRKMQTWQKKVDAYITATQFTKNKYVQAGFREDKIFVKPNFLYPQPTEISKDGEYALFVGRLREEKGVETLIKAWKKITNLPLKIAGEGPLAPYLSGYIHNNSIKNVELLGHVNDDQYHRLMLKAKFIVLPSVCYENFPRIAAEALSYGLPVIGSRLGSLEEIIDDERNGRLFSPGDEQDLVDKVQWILNHDQFDQMKKRARISGLEQFGADRNYELLLDIYQKTIGQ